MVSRPIRLLAIALFAALILAACGSAPGGAPAAPSGGAAQSNATITISLNADPPSLDPAFSSAFVDRQVHNSIYDKLVDLDANGKIVPMLATEWKVSDDGLTYTFTLREGVKFHDGTDFNAEAVKANLERYRTEEKSTRKNELKAVDSIEAADAKTLKITLKEPFAPFLSVLTDRSGMIVSPKAVADQSGDIRNQPVGTGPFKYESRVKGDTITLVRNDQYWQAGLPKAAKIVYKILTDANTALINLKAGQVDFTDSVPPQEVANLKSDSNFAVVNEVGFGYQGIWFNTKAPPLDNKQVRQAIDMLIDRDELVRVLFSGTATPGKSPFAKSNLAFGDSDAYTKPDVEKAKQLDEQEPDTAEHVLRVVGLEDETVGTALECADDILRVRQKGHENHRDVGEERVVLERRTQLVAIHLRHHRVTDHEPGFVLPGQLQSHPPIDGTRHLEAFRLQDARQVLELRGAVLGDEHPRGRVSLHVRLPYAAPFTSAMTVVV
jgi:peptide/nickel transport system substrate-binding protein